MSQKIFQYSQTGRLNIIKILILPKLIYRFNIIPRLIPPDFLWEMISQF